MSDNTLIIISGPTASGKTSLAIELASFYKTEIISADSRQIYKEFHIGVAAPSQEELNKVIHHFIKSHNIFHPLNAYDYAEAAIQKIHQLFKTHRILLMVGGSGLFLKAVYHGIDLLPDPSPELRNQLNLMKTTDFNEMVSMLQKLDPEYCQSADIKNPSRVQRALEVCLTSGKKYSELITNRKRNLPFRILNFAIDIPRNTLHQRIDQRLIGMRQNGMTEEAMSLFPYKHLSPLKTIGYRELFSYFENKCSEDEAYETIRTNTRKYAKKQKTWLRKETGFTHLKYEDMESVINNPETLFH